MNFEKLDAYLDSLRERSIPSCDFMLTLDGKCVYRHLSGFRDAEGRIPLDGREAYWVYSMTKPLTCACALRLIQDGALKLEDAVCEYLPEFSKYPTMTIEHLMSMRAGLDYNLEPEKLAARTDPSTRGVVASISQRPLSFEPGTDFQYSLCHDVLAAVIEVVSGMKFSKYMAKVIFEPLGMAHSGFHLTEYQKENMCAQYEMDAAQQNARLIGNMKNDYAFSDEYESGGAGLITTVEDYMRFSAAMAQGGKGVISMDTIELWRGRRITGKADATWRLFNRIGYGYGLGVRVMVDNSRAKSPLGEFGWDGAAGAYTLIDTQNRLAIVYAQHVRNCGFVYSDIHPTLRDMTYEAVGI